jgi:hypothetical protein
LQEEVHMSASPQPAPAEPQAPYPGHPFGGAPRDGGLNLKTSFEEPAPSDADDDIDDGAGFDFHLGVYSKF